MLGSFWLIMMDMDGIGVVVVNDMMTPMLPHFTPFYLTRASFACHPRISTQLP